MSDTKRSVPDGCRLSSPDDFKARLIECVDDRQRYLFVGARQEAHRAQWLGYLGLNCAGNDVGDFGAEHEGSLWFHNEALQRIDLLLSPVVEGAPLSVPPASPIAGSCYLVASGATGAWTGKDGMLAGYSEGGWRFVAPMEGMRVLDRISGLLLLRRSGAWESGIVRAQEYQVGGTTVVRQRQPAIADPTGGAVVDTEGRAALASILAALRTHGLIA